MLVSSIGHVKSGMKLGRPRSKAKEYSRSIVNKYCEGTNDLRMCGKVKTVIVGAEGKPSLNRAI